MIAKKQKPSYCGPTSLLMILDWYGIQANEEEIVARAKTTLEEGTRPENLLAAAHSYGLKGEWKENANIDALRQCTEKNIPVIIGWFSTNEPHYSVIIDVTKTEVVMLDPEVGEKRIVSHQEMLAVWFDFTGPYMKTPSDIRLRPMLPLEKK